MPFHESLEKIGGVAPNVYTPPLTKIYSLCFLKIKEKESDCCPFFFYSRSPADARIVLVAHRTVRLDLTDLCVVSVTYCAVGLDLPDL